MAITPNISHTLFPQMWKKCSNPIPFQPPPDWARPRPSIIDWIFQRFQLNRYLGRFSSYTRHPSHRNPTGVVRNRFQPCGLQLGYTNEDRIRNDHQRKEGFKLPSFYLFQQKKAGDIPGILMQKQANWKKTMCVSFCAIQRTRAAYVNSLCLY